MITFIHFSLHQRQHYYKLHQINFNSFIIVFMEHMHHIFLVHYFKGFINNCCNFVISTASHMDLIFITMEVKLNCMDLANMKNFIVFQIFAQCFLTCNKVMITTGHLIALHQSKQNYHFIILDFNYLCLLQKMLITKDFINLLLYLSEFYNIKYQLNYFNQDIGFVIESNYITQALRYLFSSS